MTTPFSEADKESEPLTMAKLLKLRKSLEHCKMPEDRGLLLMPTNPESYTAVCEEFGIDPNPPRVIDVWKLMNESGGKYPENMGKV